MVLRIAALVLVLSGLCLADPIVFTINGVGTGTVDTTAFDNVAFSFSITTDTTLIESFTIPEVETGFQTPEISGAGISINGLGSGTFTDLESIFASSTSSAGITDFPVSLVGTDLLDGSNTSFLTYNLQSSIGPLSMNSVALQFVDIPTSLGSVTFTLATNVFFTASEIGVPESGTLVLGAAGVLLLAGVKLLARAR